MRGCLSFVISIAVVALLICLVSWMFAYNRIKSVRLWGFADFFCFYELCEFLFVGICATLLGSGWEGVCLSAGGSPWGSTTLRLLLRETPLGSFFLALWLDGGSSWATFWVVILVDPDVLDALLCRLDRYWGWVDVRVERLYFVLVCGLADTAYWVPTLLVWWLGVVSVYCGGGQ